MRSSLLFFSVSDPVRSWLLRFLGAVAPSGSVGIVVFSKQSAYRPRCTDKTAQPGISLYTNRKEKMRPTMCARCKKNIAVVLLLDWKTIRPSMRLCLRCAKDRGSNPWTI